MGRKVTQLFNDIKHDQEKAVVRLVAVFVPARKFIEAMERANASLNNASPNSSDGSNVDAEHKTIREAHSAMRWLMRAMYQEDRDLAKVEADLLELGEYHLPKNFARFESSLIEELQRGRELIKTIVTRYGGETKLKEFFSALQTDEELWERLSKAARKAKGVEAERLRQGIVAITAKLQQDIAANKSLGVKLKEWVISLEGTLKKVKVFEEQLQKLAA